MMQNLIHEKDPLPKWAVNVEPHKVNVGDRVV